MEQTLEPCGPVLLVGSFVTGLMVWRDLDVCVDAGGLRRERAWELEAVGVGLLAAAWLAGVPLSG